MAADILLYQTDVVPVGDDQKQHIELTRDLAERFNKNFGETFTMPKPMIQRETARIYDLQNPTSKMSKSARVRRGRALDARRTEGQREEDHARGHRLRGRGALRPRGEAGRLESARDLLCLTGREISSIEDEYAGRGYGDFKKGLAEVVVAEFEPVRARALELLDDPAELDRVLASNAERAASVAEKTLADVYDRIGLLRRG